MKSLKRQCFKLLNKYWPFTFFIGVTVLFFWKVFFTGLIPIPADLVVGAYFPWLDYKWGYSVGVPVKNLITSDVVSVIYPIRSYLVDLIKSGQSSLWNPLMFGGYPLLANFQIAIFSPTTIFYFIFNKEVAWTIQIILQPFLSMFFSYLLLRQLKISKASSILGSVAYAFSGFSIIWMEWGAHGLTAALIPLILYLVGRLIESGKLYWGALLSVAICVQIFSGYPQLFIYTELASFLYAAIVYRKNLSINLLFKLFAFSMIGVLMSSIQLLPAIELLRNSQRVNENLSYDLTYLPWQNWISFFAPDFFGNHSTGNFWGVGNYTNNVGYTGIVSLCLSIVAICNFKKNNYIKYFSILFIVSLLLSFPFPWTKYIYSLHLPGIGASSLTRILIIANLSVAFLSAFGLDWIVKHKSKHLTVISMSVITILGLTLLISYFNYKNGNALYLIGVRNLIIPIALIFTTLVLSFLINKFWKYRKVLSLFFVALVLVELFRFGWKYTPFSKPSLIFPDTPVTEFLKNNTGLSRIDFGEVIPMNMWSSYNLSSVSGYDAVYPLVIAKYIAVANTGISSTTPMGRHGALNNHLSRLFDLANVKYLLVLKRDVKGNPSATGIVPSKYTKDKFTKVFDSKSVAILENKKVLPRLFFVTDWEVIKDEQKIIDSLLDSDFNLREKVVLENDINLTRSKSLKNKYVIENVNYESGKITLDLKANKDGLLFMSDTYYPGWEAYVDGAKTDILKADYAFRAIPITAKDSSHKILFIYNPISFKIGKVISGLSLLITILIFIYGYKKNR